MKHFLSIFVALAMAQHIFISRRRTEKCSFAFAVLAGNPFIYEPFLCPFIRHRSSTERDIYDCRSDVKHEPKFSLLAPNFIYCFNFGELFCN